MSELSFTIGRLHWSDILAIAMYYVVSLGIGIYTICKTKNSLNSFFLAGNSLTWWPIGMSLFASNIGSINFVGIAGSAAASGLAVVMFEWSAVSMLVLLGWVYVPVYISSGIYTIPEYLNVRFGGQRLRVYLSVIALLTYCFAILSVDVYSGALFVQQTIGWNIYIGVAIIMGTTILFTSLGGLMTVVFTDAFAVVVMIAGGFLVFILGIIRVGGFSELYRKYNLAVPNITMPNTTCGYPQEDAWHIFKHPLSQDYPGLGTLLRTVLGTLWFFCSNQLIVQRTLAAKNIVHAKAGCLLASYLKLTPMFIMVLPGMISRALFPDEIACATPETCKEICGNPAGCSNIAYPRLATELLPHGLRGLLVAAMLAAVISSLTSIFNSSSSIFTIDIWRRIRPHAKEREQMIVAKLFLIVLMAIAIAWIPIMENAEGGQIYKYAVASVGLFGGPTCGLFLLAVLSNKINEKGAFWGLIVGQAWGILRFILDIVFPKPPCGIMDTRPVFLKYWHVFYHVVSQIIITCLISLLVSMFTKPIPRSKLAGVTFWTRFDKRFIKESNDDDDIQKQVELEKLDKGCCAKQNKDNCMVEDGEEDSLNVKTVSQSDQPSEKSKIPLIKRVWIWFVQTCFRGNEKMLNKPDVPERLQRLKQSTFWTTFLNINAAIVIGIMCGLYIILR